MLAQSSCYVPSWLEGVNIIMDGHCSEGCFLSSRNVFTRPTLNLAKHKDVINEGSSYDDDVFFEALSST